MIASEKLKRDLRLAVINGANIRHLVEMAKVSLPPSADFHAFTAMTIFKQAFDLPLSKLRLLEDAQCLGGQVLSDAEIDARLLQAIRENIEP